MENKRVAIVVPTIREECIKEFLEAWDFEATGATVYVVEDNPRRTFDLAGVVHYCWKDIEEVMQGDAWIIPRRSDCIRSFGFLMAYKDGADVIITLDDDCLPYAVDKAQQLIGTHLYALQDWSSRWVSTVETTEYKGWRPRGMPYTNRGRREAVLNMGGWVGVPDMDAPQSLAWLGDEPGYRMKDWSPVPQGQYFPMCGMNLAFDTKIMPLMYFLLMGQNAEGDYYPYDRFGDIWCGIIAKKILDAWGYAVYTGEPLVHHAKASDPLVNLQKETPGLLVNEWFWEKVDGWRSEEGTLANDYCSMAHRLHRLSDVPGEDRDYWYTVEQAMLRWAAWTEGIRKARP